MVLDVVVVGLDGYCLACARPTQPCYAVACLLSSPSRVACPSSVGVWEREEEGVESSWK